MTTDDEFSEINKLPSTISHHFNPIENLLIEHASTREILIDFITIRICFHFCLGMSVYEQIASQTRSRQRRKLIDDDKLDEQSEEVEDDNGDDDEDRISVVYQVRLFIQFNRKFYIFFINNTIIWKEKFPKMFEII